MKSIAAATGRQTSDSEHDGEHVAKRSQVMEAWNAGGGSAGARSIATIVTRNSGVKMGRWLAGKLMKEPDISCRILFHITPGRLGYEQQPFMLQVAPEVLYDRIIPAGTVASTRGRMAVTYDAMGFRITGTNHINLCHHLSKRQSMLQH
ncbi:hypothetical protein CHR63_19420 [Serratia marcescens]|nr:hypothetical protein CHR63_19420 [Serratia marcescens]